MTLSSQKERKTQNSVLLHSNVKGHRKEWWNTPLRILISGPMTLLCLSYNEFGGIGRGLRRQFSVQENERI